MFPLFCFVLLFLYSFSLLLYLLLLYISCFMSLFSSLRFFNSAYFLYFSLSLKQSHLYTFFLLYHKSHFGRGNIRSFKLFPYQVMETQEEEWNVGFPSSLWHSAQLRRQNCQIPWYSFLLESEWTPELPNSGRRIEKCHGPHRESNLEPPVFWKYKIFSVWGCLVPRALQL